MENVSLRNRLLMGLLAAAAALVLLASAPHQAWAAEESESNDSFGTADTVKLGTNMYGAVHSIWAFSGAQRDDDYFAINIPAAGSYKFTYGNDDYQTSAKNILFRLYDSYYQETQFFSVVTNTTKPETATLSLKKGIYYVKVEGGLPDADTQYHFKFTPVVNKTSISKVTAAKKSATVKFKKKVGTSKYQIRYSTKSSMKSAKTVTVKASKSSAKIKKLKKGKTYYFQVRVVKTLDGKDFASGWSAKKQVKITR